VLFVDKTDARKAEDNGANRHIFLIAPPPARTRTVVAAFPMTIFAEGNGVIRDPSSRLSNEVISP
jgi:hypothetical protein